MKVETKSDYRVRRHLRLRHKITGTAQCPRMSVFKSNQHLYVQFIDDESACTLASASTLDSHVKPMISKLNIESAGQLGTLAAEAAKSKGIEHVVFDRGGFKYTGKIKALAEASREAGLKF